MSIKNKLIKNVCCILCCVIIFPLFYSCQTKVSPDNSISQDSPRIILWAWERPENFDFLDAKHYGVAFLAQTLVLENDQVIFRPRHQPLKVPPQIKLIAVTRIEAEKSSGKKAALTFEQQEKLTEFIVKTFDPTNVTEIQIDFDAAVSERVFYRGLLLRLREKLPPHVPLSITALASFCLGDRWLKDLPISEAVPMIFRMGADNQKIKSFLSNGGDFNEPLCQKSYGLATDEVITAKFNSKRRLYVFKAHPEPWNVDDLKLINRYFH